MKQYLADKVICTLSPPPPLFAFPFFSFSGQNVKEKTTIKNKFLLQVHSYSDQKKQKQKIFKIQKR